MPNKNIKKRPGRGGTRALDATAAAESARAAHKAAEVRRSKRTKAARDIESSFAKLTPAQLEHLGLDAFYTALPRPVPARAAVFDPHTRLGGNEWALLEAAQEARRERRSRKSSTEPDEEGTAVVFSTKPLLTLPKRPRWNRDMNKKALDANEAEVFKTWLRQTDAAVAAHHAKQLDTTPEPSSVSADPGVAKVPPQFERNLAVFAQLWRVNEKSDILCVLLDVRCPLLHLPPSLIDFLRAKAARRTLLVLTKADLVPRVLAEQWRQWLLEHFGEWTDVVIAESYRQLGSREGQGSRSISASFMASDSRRALIDALKRIHAQLVEPPPRLRDQAKGKNRAGQSEEWKPPCVRNVDWDVFDRLERRTVPRMPNAEKATAPEAADDQSSSAVEYLTIGLIGQPNVGKSSLLNALLGSHLVRASKTPGKTKAFQTHFVGQYQGVAKPPTSASTSTSTSTSESTPARIRLCDSPGLVFPSLIGMEIQVLGAILPISQVQALSACVRFVGAHMPLEQALRLPSDAVRPPEPDSGADASLSKGSDGHALPNKETGPAQEQASASSRQSAPSEWTAITILEHVAARYHFRTAKANRWDTNRAANWVMRCLAEGRIAWAFRPPVSPSSVAASRTVSSQGHASTDQGTDSIAGSVSQLDALELDLLLKRGHGIWLGGPHRDEEHGVGGHEDGSDDESASDTTDVDVVQVSQTLSAASLPDDQDKDHGKPVKINFRRPAKSGKDDINPSFAPRGAVSDSDDVSINPDHRKGSKKKKKGGKGREPVLSRRARLREEGLALLAAKADEVGGLKGEDEERGDGDGDGLSDDSSAVAEEEQERIESEEGKVVSPAGGRAGGGSVFLAAAAVATSSDDEAISEEDDEGGDGVEAQEDPSPLEGVSIPQASQ